MYLFTHFWLCFVAAHELSVVVVSWGYSSLLCRVSHVVATPLLQSMGS